MPSKVQPPPLPQPQPAKLQDVKPQAPVDLQKLEPYTTTDKTENAFRPLSEWGTGSATPTLGERKAQILATLDAEKLPTQFTFRGVVLPFNELQILRLYVLRDLISYPVTLVAVDAVTTVSLIDANDVIELVKAQLVVTQAARSVLAVLGSQVAAAKSDADIDAAVAVATADPNLK